MVDIKDDSDKTGLVIVNKYREGERWLYDRVVNMSNKHATFKRLQNATFHQYQLLYSCPISKNWSDFQRTLNINFYL